MFEKIFGFFATDGAMEPNLLTKLDFVRSGFSFQCPQRPFLRRRSSNSCGDRTAGHVTTVIEAVVTIGPGHWRQ